MAKDNIKIFVRIVVVAVVSTSPAATPFPHVDRCESTKQKNSNNPRPV